MSGSPFPSDQQSVTPYLIVDNAKVALEFYKNAFGAVEIIRLAGPDGIIGHAEIKVGNSKVMVADEHPIMGFVGPNTLGGTTVSLLVYVSNVDQSYAQAIRAGAKMMKPIQDQFYGDRTGSIVDPFGHVWTLATRKEHLSPQEIQARWEKLLAES